MEIKLSVAIITFNEEKNIRRCLESVKEVADEIVVVDSFSTDRTEEVCSEYGVKVIKNAFPGHIEQKNFVITQASYPHILSLDADEELSAELQKQILNAKKHWEYDGYYFNRLTNYCGKWIRHCGWYPDRKLRLFDSRKGSWGGENPHDKYEMPGARLKHLKGDLLHYSYYTIRQHIEQTNKFSDIAARAMFAKKKPVRFYKLYLNPFTRFFRDFFLKRGFLDGFYGFCVCMINAQGVFLKYAKLKALYLDRSSSS